MPCTQNEETIASAIKASGKRREDLFITSKLAPNEASKPFDRTCWHCRVSWAQLDGHGDTSGQGCSSAEGLAGICAWRVQKLAACTQARALSSQHKLLLTISAA